MYQSEQIDALAAALAKAQGQISPAIKDSSNPFFKSKYADLASVWQACKEPLSKNGLAVIQATSYIDGHLTLVTTLAHASGQWMRSFMPIVTEKQNAQGIGSAITYMRRYCLSAMVGITCDEDDDGNAAVVMPKKNFVKPAQKFNFQYPPDVDPAQMDIYITELAKECKTSVEVVMSRSYENPQGFLDNFEKWQKKHFDNTLTEP